MKFIKKTKKGFTLVELVVVIAIIAILSGVSVAVYVSVTNKAKQTADSEIISQLNLQMKAQEVIYGKNVTCMDAYEDAGLIGFDLALMHPQYGDHYVWDQVNDRFAVMKGDEIIAQDNDNGIGKTPDYQRWIFVNSINPNSERSQFLTDKYYEGEITVTKAGFDAGDNKNISLVKCLNNQNVNTIIRTNSGSLEVEAPLATIKHFGKLSETKLNNVSTNSYFEYGDVTFVNIKKGRLVIADGYHTSIDTIYLTATNDSYDSIILATMNGSSLPTVVQREHVNPGEKLVVTIQNNVDENGKNPSSIEEIWMRNEQDVEKGKTGDGYIGVSDLGKLILEAPEGTTGSGEKYIGSKETTVEKSKSGAQARAIQIDENTYELTSKEDMFLFASLVNGGETFEGKIVKLANDIDLNNENWVPIGTVSKPFSGEFDGQNHTIKNLNIEIAEMGGLFGYINGEPNPHYLVSSDVWDFDNNVFSEANICEDYYTAVVKNVNLSDVSVEGNVSGKKHIGGFCAMAGYAYFENINVYSGSVVGYKVVGGIFGAAYGCFIKNCTTGSALSVEAKSYHAGGIIGAVNTAGADFRLAIANCINNATITSNGNGSGYEGGIIGDANSGSSKAQVYYNCVNNGSISASGECVGGVVGNMGINAGESTRVVACCTNNGNITTISNHMVKNVGGIESNAAGLIYNCINYGDISGAVTVSAAGVVGSSYQTAVTLSNSVNFGDLSGVTGVEPSDLGSGFQSLLKIENTSFETVEELQEAISNAAGTVVLNKLTIADKTGTLVLPSGVYNLVADKQYFDGLDISNSCRDYVTVTIPNFDYSLHGNAITKTLGLSGINNKTTFAADCKLDWLRNYGSNGTYVKVSGCEVNLIHGATEAK